MKKTLRGAAARALFIISAFGFLSVGCGGGSRAKVGAEDELQRERTAGSVERGTPGEPELPQSELPPEYKIQPLDELEFRFDYHAEFNEIATVRPDGRLTLQKIGDVYVEGMTPSELDRLVTNSYTEVTATPDVTVFVRKFAGQVVYVLGEVRSPGAFDIKSRMTILQALVAAGGPIRGAQLGSVVVLRKGAAGQPEAMALNLSRGEVQKGTYKNEYVAAQDIIYVPKNPIASLADFLGQVYDGVLPPLEIYLRALYFSRRN